MTGNDGGRPVDRLAYSVKEAAAITGLSRDLLYDQMRTGKLAYRKVGRRRIITRQHLKAFLTDEASGRPVLTIAGGVDHEGPALRVNGHQDLAVDTLGPGIPWASLTA